MAQLRDAKTSELIAEGTPLELVLVAEKLGRDEVLFDDVGAGFKPDEVLNAHRENADGLARAARDAKGTTRKDLEAAAADAKKALEVDGAILGDATSALERARAQQG